MGQAGVHSGRAGTGLARMGTAPVTNTPVTNTSEAACGVAGRCPPCWIHLTLLASSASPVLSTALQTSKSSGVSGEQALVDTLHLTQDIFTAIGEAMTAATDAAKRE
jgi:hypothetical protein